MLTKFNLDKNVDVLDLLLDGSMLKNITLYLWSFLYVRINQKKNKVMLHTPYLNQIALRQNVLLHQSSWSHPRTPSWLPLSRHKVSCHHGSTYASLISSHTHLPLSMLCPDDCPVWSFCPLPTLELLISHPCQEMQPLRQYLWNCGPSSRTSRKLLKKTLYCSRLQEYTEKGNRHLPLSLKLNSLLSKMWKYKQKGLNLLISFSRRPL